MDTVATLPGQDINHLMREADLQTKLLRWKRVMLWGIESDSTPSLLLPLSEGSGEPIREFNHFWSSLAAAGAMVNVRYVSVPFIGVPSPLIEICAYGELYCTFGRAQHLSL